MLYSSHQLLPTCLSQMRHTSDVGGETSFCFPTICFPKWNGKTKNFAFFTKFLPGNGNGPLVSGSLLTVITVEWKRQEDMSAIQRGRFIWDLNLYFHFFRLMTFLCIALQMYCHGTATGWKTFKENVQRIIQIYI